MQVNDRVTRTQGGVWYEGKLISLKGTIVRVYSDYTVRVQWDGITESLPCQVEELRWVTDAEDNYDPRHRLAGL